MVLTSALPQTVCRWGLLPLLDSDSGDGHKRARGGGKTHSKGLRVGLEPRPLLSGLTACGCLLNQNPRLTLRKLLVCLCNT